MNKILGLATIIVVLFITACSASKEPLNANEKAIEEAKNIMQDGDLVLRMEDDFISRLLADLSPKDKKYSHAGIVKKENGALGIYNIMPSSIKNLADDSIKLAPIDSFINPKKHETFAIYRYNLTPTEKNNFVATIEAYRKQNVKFDMKFNYATDDEMYCSELIAKSLNKATNGKYVTPQIFIDKSRILGVKRFFKFMNDSVDLSKFPVITIDNLYVNEWSTFVYSYKFDPALRNPTKR